MMLRAFVAVELPEELRQAIARGLEPLRKTLPAGLVRWVPPGNVHLTLKFLGEVSPSGLEQLAEALRAEIAARPACACQVTGFGAFPNPQRARVLWAGVEAPPGLPDLARGVEAVASRLGYPTESRPFSPHLTVGRVNQDARPADLQRIRAGLEALPVTPLGGLPVGSVQVFKSDLRPTGPIYTRLYSLPLQS